MGVPPYKQWMQDTNLNILRPRSSQLKGIDEAIRQYENLKNQDNLWKLKNAFESWKRYKGAQWETSDRNRNRAITNLNAELAKVADARTHQITHFSMEELMALQHLAKERKRVIENTFRAKQVTFKAAKIKEQLAETTRQIQEKSALAANYIKGKPSSGGRPTSDLVRQKMENMVKSFFGVSGLEQLGTLSGFILDLLGKCAVSVPPVVGHIKDGYDLFVGWAKVGADLYREYNISERRYAIDTGAPQSAFEALRKCLAEETQNEVISAARATTAFALKTGLAFADGGAISGPVVGAANAIATFSHQMFLFSLEWKATKAINDELTAGNLDIRLFKTYPLMGSYLLVSATLSDLVPIDSFGTPGWMDYIEKMKKESFDEIYASATGLIDKSPWEIIGLPKRPAGHSGSLLSTAKQAAATASPLGGLAGLRKLF